MTMLISWIENNRRNSQKLVNSGNNVLETPLAQGPHRGKKGLFNFHLHIWARYSILPNLLKYSGCQKNVPLFTDSRLFSIWGPTNEMLDSRSWLPVLAKRRSREAGINVSLLSAYSYYRQSKMIEDK
jgi:hypothetical protein